MDNEKIRSFCWRYRFPIAILSVLIACFFKYLSPHAVAEESPFLFLFTAVVFSAWAGGFPAGFLATIFAAILAGCFFLSPSGKLMSTDSDQLLRLATFMFEGSLVSVLFESMHKLKTQSRELMEVAQDARTAAEEANQAKKDFIANMSHEIRTPLTAILGFTDLVLNSEVEPADKETYAMKMRANASVLSHLIDDILDISSIERGGLKIDKRKVDITGLFQTLDRDLRALAEAKGLTLEIRSKGPIPGDILTDEKKFSQIMTHVVGNAIKFANNGSITVTLTSRKRSSKLAILVKDQGIGIAPEQVRKLFQPFTQADSSTTRKFGGSGLGLSLARRLARSLGGDIKLLGSQVGQGSTFLITIDTGFYDESNLIQKLKLASSRKREDAEAVIPSLQGVRVLLVEDSPDTSLLVCRLLKMAGATVETAANGKEGVEKAEVGDYNIVLMDIQMPVMDGNEAAKELRQHHYGKPLIALSAHAMKEDREAALQCGFDDYLLKPVNRADLIGKICDYAKVKLNLGLIP
jgi:signal transduction histidine kinase/CheY-like chemotaxis protein